MSDGDDSTRLTLGAELARELIHTPAARELAQALSALPTDSSLVKTLIFEDLELTLGTISRLPALANSAAHALDALGDALERVPPALAAEFVQQLLDQVDRAAVEGALTTWARLTRRLVADPDSRQMVVRTVGETLNTALRRTIDADRLLELPVSLGTALADHLDFGLVRAAVEKVGQDATRQMPQLLDRTVTDPVLLSNLLEMLPPVLNTCLSLSTSALSALRLPPEVLASALFGLIERVDAHTAADLINRVSHLLSATHEGNMVLGRHQPRLREVLGRVFHKLSARLDKAAVARAVAALAEDTETLFGAGADLLYGDPELLMSMVSTGGFSAGALLRGLATAADKLSQLPEEEVEKVAEQLELAPATDAAELVNAIVRLLRRLLIARPKLFLDVLERFLQDIDLPKLATLVRALPGARRDDKLGRLLGETLAAGVHQLAGRPEALQATMERLDQPETRRELTTVLFELEHSLRAHPRLLDSVLPPLVAGLQHVTLEYLKQLPGRAAAVLARKRR